MNTSLNDRFKEVRMFKNLTQSEFAGFLDIKQGTISDIERKRIGVSSKVMERLLNKIPINESWFYSGIGDMVKVDSDNSQKIEGINHPFEVENKSRKLRDKVEGGVKGGKNHPDIDLLPKGQLTFEKSLELTKHVPVLLEDIKKSHPEYTLLKKSIYALSNFMDMLPIIYNIYFQEAQSQLFTFEKYVKDNRFDYAQYKADHLILLDKLKPFEPALEAILKGVNLFFEELLKVDTKMTMKGYEDILAYHKF